MIGYLEGKIIEKYNGKVIINANGIGFEVTCSSSVYNGIELSGFSKMYIYTAVREDDVSLYGFSTMKEKEMFNKLISVSGIGPKMGITILSNMGLEEIAVKIATNDSKGLSQIKGLGKKTAERIILELREKITAEATDEEIIESDTISNDQNEDAIIALMSLGFTKAECVASTKKAKELGAKSVQEIVTFALKSMR